MEKTVRRQAPIVASRRAPGKGDGAPAAKTGDPAVATKARGPGRGDESGRGPAADGGRARAR